MRLTVHGKHFHLDGRPHFLRTVTYGPFPETSSHSPEKDFPQIRSAGFDSVRIYALPDRDLLDHAAQNELIVIATHAWGHGCDFITENPSLLDQARRDLTAWLESHKNHPGLGAILVGNEIPSDMARWMTPWKVKQALDGLIRACQKVVPSIPVGYANFPTTEYLEPPSADFTAFNIYLEDGEALASYLPRLHHLAGDRPVYLTEFGLDTNRNSEDVQAALLPAALKSTRTAGFAGATLYAWSDHWLNNGQIMDDWSFGLIRRDGSEKSVLPALRELILPTPLPLNPPRFSIIICTRNGAGRIETCIKACQNIDYHDFEIIVVNDGSADGTAKLLDQQKEIRAFHLEPSGLSAARNHGAAQATGEILAFTDDDCRPDEQWLTWLAHAYSESNHAAIGGPNLAPKPESLALALTTAAPGAPTHVMIDDLTAEHLPGCHLSVKKSAFAQIEGFDPIFH
ncbi:glycosyltransferase, partial [Akkermansiaceae bacterium]|nr:glycosyltransferase [Akkermansiaceae bacterium]